MQINDREQFEKITRELQQMLAEQELRLQTCVTVNQNMHRRVAAIIGSQAIEDVTLERIVLKQAAISNGRLLSPPEMQHLSEDGYDVVLNCVDQKLLARKDPDRRTKLEECDCSGMGPNRLRLLRCWLENPHLTVCEETIPRIFGDVASMTPNALARAMLDLRKCLWNGPYIQTDKDWGESISHTGTVYRLNRNYKYLVIRYKI